MVSQRNISSLAFGESQYFNATIPRIVSPPYPLISFSAKTKARQVFSLCPSHPLTLICWGLCQFSHFSWRSPGLSILPQTWQPQHHRIEIQLIPWKDGRVEKTFINFLLVSSQCSSQLVTIFSGTTSFSTFASLTSFFAAFASLTSFFGAFASLTSFFSAFGSLTWISKENSCPWERHSLKENNVQSYPFRDTCTKNLEIWHDW